jgi:hypothetical protein
MKIKALFAIVVVSCMACNTENPKHTTALNEYKSYVDSVLHVAQTVKMYSDTSYMEVPTDPNDPSVVTVDTIVTNVQNGDSIIYHYYPNNEILQQLHEAKTQSTSEALKNADNKLLEKFNSYKTAIDTLIKI